MARMSSAVAVVLMLLVIMGASSVVNADCSQDNISGLSSCYNAVKKGGDPPTSGCCDTMDSWGIVCLCSVLSQYGSVNNLPSFMDPNEVLALPRKCGLNVQSGYSCAGYTFP